MKKRNVTRTAVAITDVASSTSPISYNNYVLAALLCMYLPKVKKNTWFSIYAVEILHIYLFC